MDILDEAHVQTVTEILVFEVDARRYSVRTAEVQEILRATTIVPLPKAPAIVAGVINLRGHVTPVLDIRSRLQLPAKSLEYTDHFIVSHVGNQMVALHVDHAVDVLRINLADIEDPRSVVPETEYVAGIAKLPDGLLLIHDLQAFLSRSEREVLGNALTDEGAPEPLV